MPLGANADETVTCAFVALVAPKMKYYLHALRNYATFSGRACRAEFWWFQLFNLVVIPAALFALECVTDQLVDRPFPRSVDYSMAVWVYRLAAFIPGIAVGVRRMHDTNHRGWWLLFPIANLALAVTEGNDGVNRFGVNPRGKTEKNDFS